MNTRKLKKFTVGVLVAVAFLFIICINPSDDSQTFFKDLLVSKSIGVIAIFFAAYLEKYWNTENTSSI